MFFIMTKIQDTRALQAPTIGAVAAHLVATASGLGDPCRLLIGEEGTGVVVYTLLDTVREAVQEEMSVFETGDLGRFKNDAMQFLS